MGDRRTIEQRALAQARRQLSADASVEEVFEEAALIVRGWGEATEIPEDTPCVESADLWGTGEGRYHRVIG